MNINRILNTLVAALSLAAVAPAQTPIIRPADGEALTRIHTRFRWEPMENVLSDYVLTVVEDDGTRDPFLSGTVAVSQQVPNAEPRIVITSGLEFGKSYAWRGVAQVGPAPGTTRFSRTYRFTTQPIPPELPPLTLTVPQGAGPAQPGVTLFNVRIGNNPQTNSAGYAIMVDLAGEIVWFLKYPARRIGDIQQLEDGRLLWIMNAPNFDEVTGRCVESTIDGRLISISPDVPFFYSIHHEVNRMPNGNYLLLVHDDQVFPGMAAEFWQGDKIIEFDRHTYEPLSEWSVFDDYNLIDYEAQLGPGCDWTHGNAATYNPLDGSVYFSCRKLTRVTRIDWATKDVVYNMGKIMPSGDATFGHNLFSFQHAPDPLPNGNLLLFDNGNLIEPLSAPRQSAAVEIAFNDPNNPTDAQIVWEHKLVDDNGDPVYGAFLGDADRLPNGNTLICSGPTCLLHEVDAASNVVWRLQVGAPFPAHSVYRADRIDGVVRDTPGDAEDDWDVDLRDLATFQNAYAKIGLAFPDTLADTDSDDDVDADDFDFFCFWLTGPSNHLEDFPLGPTLSCP